MVGSADAYLVNCPTSIKEQHIAASLSFSMEPSVRANSLIGLYLQHLFSQASGVVLGMAVSTTLFQTEISQHLLNGLAQNLVQSFMVPRHVSWCLCWSPDFSLSAIMCFTFVVLSEISLTIGWVAMKWVKISVRLWFLTKHLQTFFFFFLLTC